MQIEIFRRMYSIDEVASESHEIGDIRACLSFWMLPISEIGAYRGQRAQNQVTWVKIYFLGLHEKKLPVTAAFTLYLTNKTTDSDK